jgi:hypothetical protein
MTVGILVAAFNVSDIDFVKIAAFMAKRTKSMYGDVSISIITNSSSWLKENYDCDAFDNIIDYYDVDVERRTVNDGQMSSRDVDYPAIQLQALIELSPYDRTLLVEPNIVIGSGLINMLNRTVGNYFCDALTPVILEKSSETFGSDCNIKKFPFSVANLTGRWIPLSMSDTFNVLAPKPNYRGQYYPLQYSDSSLIIENVFALSRIIDTGNGLWN